MVDLERKMGKNTRIHPKFAPNPVITVNIALEF